MFHCSPTLLDYRGGSNTTHTGRTCIKEINPENVSEGFDRLKEVTSLTFTIFLCFTFKFVLWIYLVQYNKIIDFI